ncbi:MAG: lamin tail domain-containing protein [Eudoraea sp.]|nr:lamin tail domain-containing protein [Eudoraea sp.]
MKSNLIRLIISGLILAGVMVYSACVKEADIDRPGNNCAEKLEANFSLVELKLLYEGATIQIQEDLVIEGYVISSDKAGNFFGSLHFQDSPVFPTAGFQIEIDLSETHLFYKEGSKILIKLKGLYLGKSQASFKIGGVFNVFGRETVGRLPANLVHEHIFLSCQDAVLLQPEEVKIEDLDERKVNSLVKFDHLELIEEDQNQTFAIEGEEKERVLTDCESNRILLLNSGYSDFQNAIMPSGNGSITGVLQKSNKDYQLIIRDTTDINFTAERCNKTLDEMTTDQVYISELADPDNNNKARFLELYNSGTTDVNLDGWLLRRYTNDNLEVGSVLDLSGYIIPAKNTLVISPNAEEFEIIYGKAPDVTTGANSAADSNGDDNLELVDPFNNVIDTFGVIGEDGSGTNHEFEDGRAVRKPEVVIANSRFDFNEWTIYNDTGAEGTIKLPQMAPEDFDPGIR